MRKDPTIEFFYSFGTEAALVPKSQYQSDSEAIQAAEEAEKQLFKHRFVNGQKTLKEKLYDPYNND